MRVKRTYVRLITILVVLYIGAASAQEVYESVKCWGSYGTDTGQFRFPNGICVDSNGYVYVADGGYEPPMISNHRIQKFLSDGTFIHMWGSQGSGNGQFQDRIEGLATDNQYIYAADQDNRRVQKFTLDGDFVIKWGSYGSGNGQFVYPFGIAIDGQNYVYVTDPDLNRVQKFMADSTYVLEWNCSSSPRGIACDELGYVYVAATFSHVIRKYDSDGNYQYSWGGGGSGDGQFSYPIGVAYSNGYVYVCDQHNHRVQKFTREGVFVTKWGSVGSGSGQLMSPFFLAVDEKGYVYVTELDNHRVQKFARLPIPAIINIDPDVLNNKSEGQWVTCYIELPSGYSVEDIDTSTVAITAIDDGLLDPPLYREGPLAIGDEDEDGIPDLMVKFDRQKLIRILDDNGYVSYVEITVSGNLIDGPEFKGTDTILFLRQAHVGGSQSAGGMPCDYSICETTPNPFRTNTMIQYAVPEQSHVRLAIYDVSGRLVTILTEGSVHAGYHSVTWDSKNDMGKVPLSGVYFLKFEAGSHKETKKLILVR